MKRQQTATRRWLTWIAILVLAVALLFGLEYLGSERPLHLIEKPVSLLSEKAESTVD